jgi:hypothetical protein
VKAVFGATAFSLGVLLLAAAPGFAQAPPSASPPPPLPGFVPPYEVTRIVRSAGFNPLAPPLREGTTYVLRATDFRGILMRVVVDARSGAIRAVNRIVPGPSGYGPVGMMPPPYGAPSPYYGAPPSYYGEPSPYDMPPGYRMPPGAEPEMGPQEADLGSLPPPPEFQSGMHPTGPDVPPLPRPRPTEPLSRDAKTSAKPPDKPGDKPAEAPDVKPAASPSTAVVASPTAVVAPSAAPAASRPAVAPATAKKPSPTAIPD